jgi:hypothetical protein
VKHLADLQLRSVRDGQFQSPGAAEKAARTKTISETVTAVPILSLLAADSPRLNGVNEAHVGLLADTETPLPPILVDRCTMRVIDGMHRLMAASLQGRETIDVTFFDGSKADVFLRSVQENVAHGLPLSQAERRAAAERIIGSHPHMSDRAIGQSAGLSAKAVSAIRKRSGREGPQSNARVGRDGKVRPLDNAEARRRAAKLLTQQPKASLRDVARAAGTSPATVLDVRRRLERGEPPVPPDHPAGSAAATSAGNGETRAPGTRFGPWPASPSTTPQEAVSTVERLLRDPSLRSSERGKGILRLLHANAVGTQQLSDLAGAIPSHRIVIVAQLAHQYAKMWQEFAREMDGRSRANTAAR